MIRIGFPWWMLLKSNKILKWKVGPFEKFTIRRTKLNDAHLPNVSPKAQNCALYITGN